MFCSSLYYFALALLAQPELRAAYEVREIDLQIMVKV